MTNELIPPALPLSEWTPQSRAIEKIADVVDEMLTEMIETHWGHEAPQEKDFTDPDAWEIAQGEWYDNQLAIMRSLVIQAMGGKIES